MQQNEDSSELTVSEASTEATVAATDEQSAQAELERLTALHAERVRQIEADRWRMGERIESLEASNAELQAGFLEQTTALQRELVQLRQSLQDEQQSRIDREAAAQAEEARRLEALRGELEQEIRHHSTRAEQLVAELIKSKDELIEQARQQRSIEAQLQSTAAERLQQLRTQLETELAGARERVEVVSRSLAEARAEVEALRQRQAAAQATAERAEALLELERGRAQLAAQARYQAELEGERARTAQAERELEAASVDLRRSHARVQTLEGELRTAREAVGSAGSNGAETQRLRQALAQMEAEAQRQRRAVLLLENKSDKAKDTLSFRLGYLLIHAPKSWQGMRRLPRDLLDLHGEAKRRRGAKRGEVLQPLVVPSPSPRTTMAPETVGTRTAEQFADQALRLFMAEGIDAAARFAEEEAPGKRECASALTQLAKALRTSDPPLAKLLAERAHSLEPLPFRAKWLAFLQYDAGEIDAPAGLLASLPSDFALKPSERARMLDIQALSRIKKQLPTVPDAAPKAYEPVPNSSFYVAASSLPFHVSGYTVRTQQVLRALAATDWQTTAVLRPGYPVDRGIELDPSAGSHNVDGIRYLHVRGPHLRRTGLDEFVDSAANALVAAAKKSRPAIMHAASNHVNALPALIAARRLGIPFVYEVRGLWELTAASRNLEWERSERFLLERSLETLVARHADRVLTLTEGLRAELVSRGVPADNIELLPNAVDAELFAPRRKHPETMLRFGVNSAFVLVYAGSLLHYEGLDDLLRATAMLVAEGVDVSLVLAGDGEALENLQRLSVELKLERRVKFLGRLAPGEIPDLWSVADAAAFPRKPFEVCQIVSPLKPLEPMAMAMPVVVSDVAALREMVRDDVTGLVHRAGDPASLAAKLRLLISDPALRERLGRAAREQILRERTWQVAGRRLAGLYGELQISGAIEPLELPSGRSSMTTEEKALFEAKLEEAYRLGGAKVLRELIRRQAAGRGARFLAFALLKAASLCQRLGDPLALELAREALGCEDSAATLRGVARIAYAAGEFVQAAAIVDRLESAAGNLTGKDDELAREVRGRARILQLLAEPIGVTARDQLPVAGRCVYFLHFSLPYSSVGYATRSHGLITGMQAAGCDVRAYTRCGFPFDFKPELEAQAVSEIDLVDGVEYHRLLEGGRRGSTESEYLLACVEAYERVLIAENPAIVHAASNYVTALPALIAARRLGLPFIYEIRGFWEITRSSRDNEFENSARYALMRHFEGVVAQAADHVFTLTSAMREELVRRGVEAGKITLVHNGVDPQRFVPLSPNRELAERIGLAPGVPVIGYVGSFVDYEGLDDLIQACALVAKGNLAFRLLLVGDGAEMAHLRQLTTQVGLEEHVLFTGRVPHEDVEGYYSLVDICPFPRKPWEVCEMVSPLKPFEAMAMRKAVVVSSTHALREIVNHGETGLVFDKGSPEALAETLRRLLSDHELRERLAENGRLWATQHRSWQASGRVVAEGYRALLEDRCSSNQSRVPA